MTGSVESATPIDEHGSRVPWREYLALGHDNRLRAVGGISWLGCFIVDHWIAPTYAAIMLLEEEIFSLLIPGRYPTDSSVPIFIMKSVHHRKLHIPVLCLYNKYFFYP